MRKGRMFVAGCFLAIFFAGIAFAPPARALGSIVVTLTVSYNGSHSQSVGIDAYATDEEAAYPGAPLGSRYYRIYYANHTPATAQADLADAANGHYTATASVKTLPAGAYYVYAYIAKGGGDYDSKNESFTINHMFYFDGGPVASCPDADSLIVASVPFHTTQDVGTIGQESDNIVLPENVTEAKYEIHVEAGALINEGQLSYVKGQWTGTGPSPGWAGSGNYYAVAKFTLTNGTTVTSPNGVVFPYSNPGIDMTKNLLLIGIVGAVIFIGVAIIVKKKSAQTISGKKPKKEKKEIKVLSVTEGDIKKAKQGKQKVDKPIEEEKQEKGVTKKSDNLIFEVPQWEAGDDDGEFKQ